MLTFRRISALFREYPEPRYWLLLMGLLATKCLLFLPTSFLIQIGKSFGFFGFYLAKRRRAIALKNIQACFPELQPAAQNQLLKKHFISLGLCLVETSAAWMMSNERLNQQLQVKVIGQGYLDQLKKVASATGVIFVTAHFMPLELMGRYFGDRGSFDLVYQMHNNPLFEKIMRAGRTHANCIERREIRNMVRSLKKGHSLWYCPDQDFGAKVSVFAPFFGIACATSRGLSWLGSVGHAQIIPASFKRVKLFQYEVTIHQPFDIPSGDEVQDAVLYNAWLEAEVRKNPADYFWVHRRFKTRPEGEAPFY